MTESRVKPLVVFDCNILVQGLGFPNGPAGSCLRLVDEGSVELAVSRSTLEEARKVLSDPEVRAVSAVLDDVVVHAFLKRLRFRARLVRRVRRSNSLERDPSDEIYLDLASTIKADYLVSRDRDLLSLATSHTSAAKEFRSRTHPLEVVDPVTFLQRVAAPRDA